VELEQDAVAVNLWCLTINDATSTLSLHAARHYSLQQVRDGLVQCMSLVLCTWVNQMIQGQVLKTLYDL
jgi:hypothetical protein